MADILKDRILVGHAVHNDLKVLLLKHPKNMTRDTASYGPLRELAGTKRPALRNLSKKALGMDIQEGEHSSVCSAFQLGAVFIDADPNIFEGDGRPSDNGNISDSAESVGEYATRGTFSAAKEIEGGGRS